MVVWEFFDTGMNLKLELFQTCSHVHVYGSLISHYNMELNKQWKSSCRRTKCHLTVTDSKILSYLWNMCKNYNKTCQKIVWIMHDFRLLARSSWELHSSGFWHSKQWWFSFHYSLHNNTEEHSSHVWITFIYKTKSMHKLWTYTKVWSFTTRMCVWHICAILWKFIHQI